jgi:F-type H+-transporting ATPase subunit b
MIAEFLADSKSWVALSFAIFAAFMWFKARGAVASALDAQILAIRADLDSAEKLRKEAEELFKNYERMHQEAIAEAGQIVRNAEKQAAAMRKQADDDLNIFIGEREKNLQHRIERMKQTAIEDMQRYAADLALQATAGLIQSKIDHASGEKLIDSALGVVQKSIH